MNKRIVCLHGLLIKPSRGSHCSSDEHTQLLAVRQSHPQLLIYLLQSLPSLHSVMWTDFLFFSKGPNFNSSLFLFKIFHYANTHREVTFEGDVRIIFACSTDLEMIFFFFITSKKHLVVILIFQNVFLKGSSRSQIPTSGVAKDKKMTLYYHYYYNFGVFFLSWTKKKKRRTKKDQTVSFICTKLCSLIHTRHLNMPHF